MLETNNDIDFSTNNDIPIEDVIAQMEKELQMSGEYYVFTSADPPRQLLSNPEELLLSSSLLVCALFA